MPREMGCLHRCLPESRDFCTLRVYVVYTTGKQFFTFPPLSAPYLFCCPCPLSPLCPLKHQRDSVGVIDGGPQWDEEVEIFDKEGQEAVEISLVFEGEPAGW